MLLIAEIILTIFVWKKWKWLALLPLGLAVLIGSVYGYIIGMNGGTDVSGAIVIDVLAIVALIIMLSLKRNDNEDEVKT